MKRLVLLIALATVGAVATTGSKAAVGGSPQVVFHGSMCCVLSIDGTFTIDHFEVKTPLDFPYLASPPVPHLIAVGTVTVTRADVPPDGQSTTWTDAPFDWVNNITVTARCGGQITVNLNGVGGSDYYAYIVASDNLWDASVPDDPWGGYVHWGISALNPVTLAGTRGTSCSIAQLAGNPKALKALAAALNRALAKS